MTLLIIISILVGLPRTLGVSGAIYQAVAHCWVGGLFGAYLGSRNKHYLWLGLALTALEVVCFLLSAL